MNDYQKIMKTKRALQIMISLYSVYFLLLVYTAIVVLENTNEVNSSVFLWTITILLLLIIVDGFLIYRTYKSITKKTILKHIAIKRYDERTRYLTLQANEVTLFSIVFLLPFVMIYGFLTNSMQILVYSFSVFIIIFLVRLIVGLIYKIKN